MKEPAPKKKKNRTLQKIKNDSIYYAARAVMAFAAAIPLRWGLKIGAVMGRGAFALLRSDRKKALAHLGVAFPEKDDAWRVETARRSFMHLGMNFFELFHFDEILEGMEGRGPWAGYVVMENRHYMEQTHKAGLGGHFITAHCGNWELMAAMIVRLGYPVNTVVRKLYDPRLDKLLNDHRERYRYHPIWREGKAALPEIVRVFQNNEFMGILMDQDTRVRGVFAWG